MKDNDHLNKLRKSKEHREEKSDKKLSPLKLLDREVPPFLTDYEIRSQKGVINEPDWEPEKFDREKHNAEIAQKIKQREEKGIGEDEPLISLNWSEEELTRVTQEWSKVLRLADWKIVAKFVRGRDLLSRKTGGECVPCSHYKEAVIKILHPTDAADFTLEGEFPLDIEHTLVHELLEIHFDHFKDDTPGLKNTLQEVAINMIADALVSIRRFFPLT